MEMGNFANPIFACGTVAGPAARMGWLFGRDSVKRKHYFEKEKIGRLGAGAENPEKIPAGMKNKFFG